MAGWHNRDGRLDSPGQISIDPELLDDYAGVVRDVVANYYSSVTRCTTSAFMRAQLGRAFQAHDESPKLYGSHEEP